MEYSHASDRGRARLKNEDSVLILQTSSSGAQAASEKILLLLADGMGGHCAGDVASAFAVRHIAKKAFLCMYSDADPDYGKALYSAIEDANREIIRLSAGDIRLRGMGTTIVSAIISGRRMHAAHAGDSRLYVIDPYEIKIRRMTHDHSLVQELIDSGRLTPQEALRHPQRGLLTKALGTRPAASPDLCEADLESGSIVLLCSDGLTDVLSDEEIMYAVLAAPDLKEAVCALIDLANERGGPDNVSAILAKP